MRGGVAGKHAASVLRRGEFRGLRRELEEQRAQFKASQDALQKAQAEKAALQEDLREQRAKNDAGQKWLQWLQISASFATVLAVVLAGVSILVSINSLKQQESTATSDNQESRYSSVYQLYLGIDQEIASYPRFVPYFEDRKVPTTLDVQDQNQVYAIAVYIVDFYQYLYDQLENLNYAPEDGLFVLLKDANSDDNANWVSWSQTIYDGFYYSPEECQVLEDASTAYGQDFVHAVAVTRVCPSLTDPGA